MTKKKAKQQQVSGSVPAYLPLRPVQCIAFSDNKTRKKNMKWVFKQSIPRLWDKKIDRKDKIALIAGGPSLNETYKDIPKDADIMVCGSAHDHAVRLGIKPKFALECDPSLIQIDNYKENPKDCTYLVASRCDKTMFKHLKGRNVLIWHMWEQELGKEIYQGEPAFLCGATVFLASIPLSLALGYKEFHIFGADSSFKTFEQNHAYPMHEPSQVIDVKVGDPKTGPLFRTTATWAGQAQQYQDMVHHWGNMFKAKIYGDGMLAEMERQAGRQ